MLVVKRTKDLSSEDSSQGWLIEGILQTNSCAILCAAPKSCKTWLAWDVAISLASGQKCLNSYAVGKPRRVLVFNAEDSEQIQKNRIESIASAKGVDPDIPNLGVIAANGELRLDTEEGINTLRKVISAFKADLIILDCFIRFHRIDENNAKQVAPILASLRAIQKELHVAILLVHHARKDGGTGGPGNAIRGSGELFGWVDSLISLSRTSSEEIKMDVVHRGAESFSDVPLRLATTSSGISLVHCLTKRSEIMPYSEGCEDTVLSLIESRIFPVNLNSLLQQSNLGREEVLSSVYRLIKDQKIKHTAQGYLRL